MQWVERIHLRAFSEESCRQMIADFEKMKPLLNDEGLVSAEMIGNVELETDVAIIIIWKGEVPPSGKSQRGVELSTLLSEYGSYNRTSWKRL